MAQFKNLGMKEVILFLSVATRVRLAFVTSFILFPMLGLLAQPSWIDQEKRLIDYPESKYLFGIASMQTSGTDSYAYEDAKRFSISNLSEQIFIEVINSEEAGDLTYFDKNALNISTLISAGLNTEFYLDSLNQAVFAFSTLEKRGFVKTVYLEMRGILDQLKEHVISLDTITKQDRNEMISKFSGLLIAARFRQDVLRKLDVGNATVLMQDQFGLFQEILDEVVLKAQEEGDLSLEDKISLMVSALVVDLPQKVSELNILPITFQNSDVGTEFSAFFQERIELQVKREHQVTNDIFNRYKLSGSYWIRDDQVQVAVTIHEYDGAEPYQVITSESMFLTIEETESLGLTYVIPAGQKINAGSVFLLNEPNGGLQCNLNTQKGNRSLVFNAGDILELTVTVSQPSYIRLIDVAEDGTQLSVLDNYFISEVNVPVEMPFQWQTECPCGTEYLKLFAQSKPFKKQEISLTEEGYEIIQGDL